MQVKLHEVPSQVGVPLGSLGQAVHEMVPQFAILTLLTQAPPHRW